MENPVPEKVIVEDPMVMLDSVNLDIYDHVIIAFSGGKDSLSCILRILEIGVPRQKIELWHHLIDAGGAQFMDWKVTKSYVQAIANALGLPVYYSWREEGYLGELIRENALPHNVTFETPTGNVTYEIKRAQPNTRRKFPLLSSSDLNKRWCTSTLKIDVGRLAISHQERFNGKKILFVTGERAEESINRSQYKVFEIHKMDNRNGTRRARHVDAWRPVHKWTSEQVWSLIEKWKINPHPCYKIGWGRCSCACCIFSSPNQVATLKQVCPHVYEQVLARERAFDFPIHFEKRTDKTYRKIFLDEFAGLGDPSIGLVSEDIASLNSDCFSEEIIIPKWSSPKGRWGDRSGPS